MMVRVVELSDLNLAPGRAGEFIREREAMHDSYHRVYAPSDGVSMISANAAIWDAASRLRQEPLFGPEYILVHVKMQP